MVDQRHLTDDAVERLAQGCWRVDDDGLEGDHGLCSALNGSVARHLQVPDHLDRAVGGFRAGHSLGRQARRVLRSQRRADRFFRSDTGADDWGGSLRQQYAPLACKKRDRPRTIRPGALNANGMERAERSRPGFESPVSFGAYGDYQRPKTGAATWTSLWVSTPRDFDRVGLAHVENSPEVRA